MTRACRASIPICLTLILSLLAGCTRDPSVLKKRYFQKGEAYFQQGKYNEAVIAYGRALQYDKEYADAHYGLARSYMKLATYPAAYAELSRTLEFDPKNLRAHIDIGLLLLGAGNYDTARQHAEFVLDENPDNVEARVLLADIHLAMGEMEAAFKEINKAIAIDPKRPSSYLNLAIFYGVAGKIPEAEATFKKAMEMDPKSIAPVMALGEMYEQLHRGPEAEKMFLQANSIDPKDSRPREALVRVYLAQGKIADAEKFLQQTVQANPGKESDRQLANFYIQTSDLARATQQYQAFHSKYPDDLQATRYYIQLMVLSGRFDEAEKLNDEILKDRPRDAESLILRAQILMGKGKPAEAADLMDKLLQAQPENALAHHYLGKALALGGNMTRAETEWREAARLNPNLLEAQTALTNLALLAQNYQLLDQSVSQLINAQPTTPRWYVYRAMAEIDRGDLSAAEDDLQRAMKVGPQNPMPFSKMGVLRKKQKRTKEAEDFFTKALDRDPSYFEAVQGLADLYMDERKPDAALERVKLQISKVSNNAAVTHLHWLLGTLYLRLGEKNQAEGAFKSAVVADPANVDALVAVAQLYYERGAIQSAMDSYEQAMRTNSRDPRSYVLLGSVYETKGNFDKAQELYEKALRVQPDNALASNNLAYMLLERGGNLDYAASLAQVARKAMPDSSSAADTLGWAYYKKGAFSLAVDLLEEATKKEPTDATFQYHLGLAYQGTHDRERARLHLQKALLINPQSPRAPEIQQLLKKLERG